jgi:hypothetical protein
MRDQPDAFAFEAGEAAFWRRGALMRLRGSGAAWVAAGLFAVALQAQGEALRPATSDVASQAATATPPEGEGDEFTAEFMAQHVPALLERANTTPDGSAGMVMKRYPGHYLNLMVRVRTGIGEMHANWSDILVCLDGEADVITGGTLVDRKDQPGGESRGSRSEGGTHHKMRKGDMIHILPNTPHWTVLPPGEHFVFWAVKIEAPEAVKAEIQ